MSVSHLIKPYKNEVWIEGSCWQSYQEFLNDEEDTGKELDNVKNKIKQLCLCTPKDLFPSDENGDTFYNINERMDELFDELNDLEWHMSKIHFVRTILDDWQYTGNKDPKKDWDEICPDLYADLRKDLADTIKSMDGNPETIKKIQEETKKMNEELAKKLKENEEA